MTGSLAQLNIRNVHDETIADHWKGGTRTSMGIAIPGFPNMFFLYGPQAPTAFSNGPSCTQFQAEFVEEMMKKVLRDGITRIDATKEAEEDWCRRMYVAFPPTRKQKKNIFTDLLFALLGMKNGTPRSSPSPNPGIKERISQEEKLNR